MQQHPNNREQCELDTKGYNLHIGSQGWPYGIGDNLASANVLSKSSLSMNQLHSQSSGLNSEMPDSVCRQEHGSITSPVVPWMGEYTVHDNKRDQIDSSKAYSYLVPQLRDNTQAHGHPELIYPGLHPVPHCGTSLPFVLSEEPVYVNAKQYHAILRRRQLRAKAEMENKLTRVRKPYLHESRHQHALRRARGCGGRFVNTKKADTKTMNATTHEGGGGGGSGSGSCSTDYDSPPVPSPDSDYAPAVSSGLGQPSTRRDHYRTSLDAAKYFQWACQSK
ncbi:nuclear factor Y [Perilla frutescens var. hirtella]|nr:nuclear factor Y [Perilla frutescens var. frutescens]KAH6793880.1 nuclear factor Y [Perilla frutescens var. hirtella]